MERTRVRDLVEAMEKDPWDVARDMIENDEKLRRMLNTRYDQILVPAFREAQKQLKGYAKVGMPNRAAPDLLAQLILPAVRRYADEVQRIAQQLEAKHGQPVGRSS